MRCSPGTFDCSMGGEAELADIMGPWFLGGEDSRSRTAAAATMGAGVAIVAAARVGIKVGRFEAKMMWQGKALGATVGVLAAGPVGGLFGAVIGHLFDVEAETRLRGKRDSGPAVG